MKGEILLKKRWKGGITGWGPKVIRVHQGFSADGMSRGLDMKGEIEKEGRVWLFYSGLVGGSWAGWSLGKRPAHDVNRRGEKLGGIRLILRLIISTWDACNDRCPLRAHVPRGPF